MSIKGSTSEKTSVSAEDIHAPAPLLHVVDGRACEGRVRRAERLRRDFNGYAIVVGGLDEECRCAGLGLHSIGSAPWRSIARTVLRTRDGIAANGMRHPTPLAWSLETAMELASACPRLILVVEGPPPHDCDHDRVRSIEIIAPDEPVARAWSLAGAASTRIVEPCALASGAPAGVHANGPIGVLLVPSQDRGGDALALFHRVGLVHLAGADVVALLDETDPGFPVVDEYARRIGIEQALEPINQVNLRPRARIAFVGGVRCATTDERTLDLAAQRIAVVAIVREQFMSGPAPARGVSLVESADAISGCKILMQLCENPDKLAKAQGAARTYAGTRDPRSWCATMAVATSGTTRHRPASS